MLMSNTWQRCLLLRSCCSGFSRIMPHLRRQIPFQGGPCAICHPQAEGVCQRLPLCGPARHAHAAGDSHGGTGIPGSAECIGASCRGVHKRVCETWCSRSRSYRKPAKASMRRMMSAFVPAGDFEWRKPNFLQSISRPSFWFMRRPRQVIHHVILAPRHIIFKLLVMIATWPHRRRPSATKSSSVLSGHLGKLRLLGLRCRFAGPF